MLNYFIFVTILGFISYSQAQLRCSNLFSSHQKIQMSTASKFNTTIQSIKKLEPIDLLTADYIAELEKKIGPVKIQFTILNEKLKDKASRSKLDVSKYNQALNVQVKSANNAVISFTLFSNRKSDYLTIDGLEVSNPLASNKNQLHMQQDSKGLSLEIFNKSKNAIINKIKQDNWKGLICVGTTHYLVSMLYQRSLQMKPTEKSAPYYNYLSMIRKSFTSSDKFYEALGSIRPNMSYMSIETLWRTTSESQRIEKGFSPIYHDDKIAGVTYKGSLSNMTEKTFVVDPKDSKYFLTWSKMFSEQNTELIVNF